MSDKVVYARKFQELAQELDILGDLVVDLDKTYFTRGYNSGGGSEIVDGDLTSLGITAADLSSGITLCQQLKNFFANAAVTQGDYQATLSKLRADI